MKLQALTLGCFAVMFYSGCAYQYAMNDQRQQQAGHRAALAVEEQRAESLAAETRRLKGILAVVEDELRRKEARVGPTKIAYYTKRHDQLETQLNVSRRRKDVKAVKELEQEVELLRMQVQAL